MGVSQEHAVKIAQDFLRARVSECPVRLDSAVARHEVVGDGHRWAVMFERVTSPDVVVSPGEVIVLVDQLSGTPKFGLPV